MSSAIFSFLSIFAILFIFLKLLGLNQLSWWWLILSPIWLSFLIYAIAFILAVILIIINKERWIIK